jgi:Skp family chaperone for outer membrane proteins
VEIPLDRSAFSTETSTGIAPTAVAYVDMQKVFSEHPLTKRYQDEFKADVEKRKKEIDDLENQIAALNKIIIASTTVLGQAQADIQTLKSAPLATGTTAAFGNQQSSPTVCVAPAALAAKQNEAKAMGDDIDKMRQQMKEKREEINTKITQGKEELTRLEERQTADVLADLYRIFERISREQNITLIFDKTNILYGRDARDMTTEVLDRLRGR